MPDRSKKRLLIRSGLNEGTWKRRSLSDGDSIDAYRAPHWCSIPETHATEREIMDVASGVEGRSLGYCNLQFRSRTGVEIGSIYLTQPADSSGDTQIPSGVS